MTETAERDECYTVMRPVVETAYRTEYHTVYQPVTTCQHRRWSTRAAT